MRDLRTCHHPLKINLVFFPKPEKLCVIAVWRAKGDHTFKPTPIKALDFTDQASLAGASERDTVFGVYRVQGIPEATSLCPSASPRCRDSLSYLDMTSGQKDKIVTPPSPELLVVRKIDETKQAL